MNGDKIPIVEWYRGVGLHNCQSPERLERVRREIDVALDCDNVTLLVELCADHQMAPEARLTASAKLRAMHKLAAEDREKRPAINLKYIEACTCSLDSRKWRSPTFYGSGLEPGEAPGERRPRRDTPLDDEARA